MSYKENILAFVQSKSLLQKFIEAPHPRIDIEQVFLLKDFQARLRKNTYHTLLIDSTWDFCRPLLQEINHKGIYSIIVLVEKKISFSDTLEFIKANVSDVLCLDKKDTNNFYESIETSHYRLQTFFQHPLLSMRFERLINATNDGLWDWNLKDNTIQFSKQWKLLLGYSEDELTHSPEEWFDRIHPEDQATVQEQIKLHLEHLSPALLVEYRIKRRDNEYLWAITRGIAYFDQNGQAESLVGSLTDMTEKLVYDALTGLPNKLLFLSRMQQLCENKQTNENMGAVLFIDIDSFKKINHGFGETTGDQFIVQLSLLLKDEVDVHDMLARLGGDEFGVFLHDVEHVSEVNEFIQQLQKRVEKDLKVENFDLKINISFGIAFLSKQSPEEALIQASSALYAARKKYRSQKTISFFDDKMKTEAARNVQIEAELSHAIENQEFYLHYQPIWTAENKILCGFEALARWKSPKLGFISPLEFIAIAEESQIILRLGKWIFGEVCRQLRVWQDQYNLSKDFTINVNVSAGQFRSPNFVGEIKSIIQKHHIDPKCINLELTESMIMENTLQNMDTMRKLNDLGFRLAIDDFGTGYSSLEYLPRFPISALKIDRVFVNDMQTNPSNNKIVRAIVSLAHNLSLSVTAEGVETEEQLNALTSFDCDQIQGYLLGRPSAAEQACKLLSIK